MELIAFVIALVAIFAVKSVAILRYGEDEINNSLSFSWTKPGAMEAIAVPEMAVAEEPVVREHVAWTPSYAATRVRMA